MLGIPELSLRSRKETVSKSHKTGQDALSPIIRELLSTEQGHPALDDRTDMRAKVSLLYAD